MKKNGAMMMGLCAVVLGGCVAAGSTKQAYEGNALPASKVAIVGCGIGAQIRAVDTNKEYSCEPLTGALGVLPGSHEYEVWLKNNTGDGTWRSQQGKMIRFSAKAGHTYSVTALRDQENKYKSDGWVVAVTDRTSKENCWILHPNKEFMCK